MAQRTLQASVVKTGAFNGASLSISNSDYPLGNPDWLLTLNVKALTAGAVALFAVYDSVDAFTNKQPVAVFSVAGKVGAEAQVFSVKKYQVPSARFGTASAVLRLELVSLTGSSPSVTYEAFVNDAL